ncbi:GAF domain-containing sensor histidine kinase [Nocardioides panacisoli]|uniref:Sensor-like histidine kinase SenX3 n=1 Tax=Nocardioides panacisoli TaxID=627624 RepID=A0ABP7I8A6_9ACTN
MVATPGIDADNAIDRYGALQEPGGDLEALAELAALVCDVPNAAINLITSDHQHQIAAAGIDPSVCSRDDSMCAIVLDDRRTVVSPDAREDPRFAANPFVNGAIDTVRFYASAPLVTPDGTTIGRLCVFDTEAHELAQERAELLQVVAARVMDVLELRLRGRQLAESLDDLTRAQEDLQRSNEMLSLFAGQVSHDLRSPLTAVLANAELLATEPAVAADPDAAGLVSATIRAGRRMATMIERILEQARGSARAARDEVDLQEVLDQVLADLGPVIASRSASVTSTPLPRVAGDAELLYSVLLNLLSNAIKFTPVERTPSVSVDASREDHTWRVVVADNGRGIAPEHRSSVFELNVRGDRSVEGNGIGLATARRAVEAHGGRIGIEQTSEDGSAFWFTLPA